MIFNRDDMDDIPKEWHDMARRDISKRRMLASAGAGFSVGDVFSSVFGTSAADAYSVPTMLSVPELEQVPAMDSGAAMTSMEVVRSEERPR